MWLLDIGVIATFIVDDGGRAVTSEDLCGVGQSEEDIANGADDGFCVASRKVGTSYGTLEEGVARKQYVFIGTIIAEAAWSVPRGTEDGEGVGAELDGRLMGYIVYRWLWWYTGGIEAEGVHVFTQLLVLCEIGHTALNIELVVTMNISAPHDVVEMEMGAEHVNKLETFVIYIAFDGCPLYLKHASWVDDAGFEGIIADDIAVFYQRIDLKGFDIQHN